MFPDASPPDVLLHLAAALLCLPILEHGPITLSFCFVWNVVYAIVYLFGRRRIAAWWARHIISNGPEGE